MAADRAAAAADLRSKLMLEARLRREWRAVEKSVVRRVVADVSSALVLPDVEGMSAALAEPVLLSHYERVVEEFSGRVEKGLPPDARLSDEEKAALAASLAGGLALRAKAQSSAIAKTNAKDAATALEVARLEADRLVSEGQPALGRRGLAIIAGVVLDRRLRGRTEAVVVLETQAPAEGTKFAEAEALGFGAPGSSVKEWVTQGDDRVRPHHLDVDSDQVAASEPFEVMGEQLMFPGDTSLGASPENVVNCRCAAVYDVESVASARQR